MVANEKQKNRSSLTAKGAYPLPTGDAYGITDKGYFLDSNGPPYRNQGGRLIPDGEYSPRKHGALIPKGLVKENSNRSELLAAEPRDIMEVTSKGFFIDKDGKVYMQTKGRLYDAGGYDDTIHGDIVPKGVVQKNNNRSELIAGNFPAKLGTPISQEDALKAIQTANQNRLAGGMTRSQYNKFRQTLGAQMMLGEV